MGSPNLELFINCKPFYSPQEFSSFILVNVYIPLNVCEHDATTAGWTNLKFNKCDKCNLWEMKPSKLKENDTYEKTGKTLKLFRVNYHFEEIILTILI